MKKTENELREILKEAREAAYSAGEAQKAKLAGKAAFALYEADPLTGQKRAFAGTMSDLCGMAYAIVSKQSMTARSKAVKQMLAEGLLRNWDSGFLVRLQTTSQYISVREAEAEAAAAVMQKYGYVAYVESRLD